MILSENKVLLGYPFIFYFIVPTYIKFSQFSSPFCKLKLNKGE